jgi:uncharacterized membrane protein YkoI
MRGGTLMLVGLAASATALADGDHDTAYRMREERQVMPLEQLLDRMQLGEGARLLEIEAKLRGGRRLYEVEYVDADGRVQKRLLDARTGEILTEDD